jgi:CRP/FNR family transcriptional regulator
MARLGFLSVARQGSAMKIDTPALSLSCGGQECPHVRACQIGEYEAELPTLRDLVVRTKVLQTGESLYHAMSTFHSLYAVREGMAKSVTVDLAGNEHVLAFHLPGEIIGWDAIDAGVHHSAVVALCQTRFCRLPRGEVRELTAKQPEVAWHLMRLASRTIAHQQRMGGNYSAEERLAAFLVDIYDRRVALGFRGDLLPAELSRGDMGNHLRLVPETVSRLLSYFAREGFVARQGHKVAMTNIDALRGIGRALLM